MRVSSARVKQLKRLCACAVLLPFIDSVALAASVPSLIMPKAEKSLLVDLDQVGSTVVAVGERGHILISQDLGKTWEQSVSPIDQMLTAVEFVNEQTGWAVGHDGNVISTTDGGKTWVLQRDGLKAQSEANVQALHDAKADVTRWEKYVADIASGAVVYEAPSPEDYPVDEYGYAQAPLTPEEELEEAQWRVESAQRSLNEDVVSPPLMDVWFADHNNGWAVGAFGNIVETKDGGKTWVSRKKDIGNPDNFHLNAVIGGSNGSIYVGGEAGFLAYSLDKGATWQKADMGDFGGSIFGLVSQPDGSYVLATGLRGSTFRSTDNGSTWEQLNPGVDYSLAAGNLFGFRSLALVGTGGTIAISKNRGTTFKQYTLPSRSSLSSVLALKNGTLILAGQGGIHHFDPTSASEEE